MCGEALDTLFRGSAVAGAVAPDAAFPWYVGWTGRSRLDGQRDALARVAPGLRATPAAVLAQAGSAIQAPDGSVLPKLTDSLADALAMLDAARAGGKDLLLVLD